jgi:hypothetical protein
MMPACLTWPLASQEPDDVIAQGLVVNMARTEAVRNTFKDANTIQVAEAVMTRAKTTGGVSGSYGYHIWFFLNVTTAASYITCPRVVPPCMPELWQYAAFAESYHWISGCPAFALFAALPAPGHHQELAAVMVVAMVYSSENDMHHWESAAHAFLERNSASKEVLGVMRSLMEGDGSYSQCNWCVQGHSFNAVVGDGRGCWP